ncbi:MAG: metal-dependent hydrolase [Gammaproteobacteria bacterium]|nr:metal-dependent hydrolase [Gammaproteobacteria bacterium]
MSTSTHHDTAMPVRKMDFGFSAGMPLDFFADDPVRSYLSHAYWMTMPYLEPYLMRTVRTAMQGINDPVLRAEMQAFCGQEGQHFQQHARVNRILKESNPAFSALDSIEAELEADYRRFSTDKDIGWNLAYAEAFEAMTMTLSCTQMEMRIHEDMSGPIRELFLWHITEEMEHRTVCFDACHAHGVSWWRRLQVGREARAHYLGYVGRFHAAFLRLDAERIRQKDTAEKRIERERFQAAFAKQHGLRGVFSYLPWYNPRRVTIPGLFESLRAHYSSTAVTVA